jgi:hypothetical protein
MLTTAGFRNVHLIRERVGRAVVRLAVGDNA